MIDCGSLEYAQARIQARHGQRPDEATWRRIELAREFAPVLELARGTALRPWLVGITADSDSHRVEVELRRHWRAFVAEVAGWMPTRWQPGLVWCATLPDLAPLQHLARGGEPPPWMRDDSEWRAVAQATPSQRAAALAEGPLAPLAGALHASPLAGALQASPLAGALQASPSGGTSQVPAPADAWAAPQAIASAWLAEWRRRLPRPARAADDALERLVRIVADHRRAFARATPGQGWMLRAALRERLTLLLRRVALDPAVVFIHLGLAAIEVERLRAELLRRLLFPRWKGA